MCRSEDRGIIRMEWRPVAGLADAAVGWESKVVWGKEQRGQCEIPKR